MYGVLTTMLHWVYLYNHNSLAEIKTLFCIGQKNQRNIHFPEVLDGFRKENGIIKSVSINKFHSVFVDQTGQVFTCGHGHGGRLGHNSEHSVISPARLKRLKDEVCVQAAIAIDHTILLMETGSVSLNKEDIFCNYCRIHKLSLFFT